MHTFGFLALLCSLSLSSLAKHHMCPFKIFHYLPHNRSACFLLKHSRRDYCVNRVNSVIYHVLHPALKSGWRRRISRLRNAGIRKQNNHKAFKNWVHRQGTICFITTTFYDQNLCKCRLLERHRFLFFNVLQRGNSGPFLF